MPRNVIVVVVDRLGAGFLGPYGATWLDTPGFNRFASQALLIEHALGDAPDLLRVYRSYWTGRHAAMPEVQAPTLAGWATAAGCHTRLLTDDPALADHPLARDFQERRLVPRRAKREAARRVEQTQLARVFAAAGEWLGAAPSPFVLWIHAEGMQGLWDAPWELRTRWTDEDDPPPPTFVEPPTAQLTDDLDPDEMLGLMHAYAGQVAVLDACFAEFLHTFLLNADLARDTLLMFTAPCGYPLGEHRRIGPVEPALYGEVLRVPLLLRFPDGAGAGHRAQAIVQPPDVCATVREWLGGGSDWARGTEPSGAGMWGRSLAPLVDGSDWPRDRALAVGDRQRAVRTPAWFLSCHEAETLPRHETSPEVRPPRVELYVKPDDLWEINEVSDRAPQVAEALLAVLENLHQAVAANDEAALLPLSEVLREGV